MLASVTMMAIPTVLIGCLSCLLLLLLLLLLLQVCSLG
jgi:hypothetical protein